MSDQQVNPAETIGFCVCDDGPDYPAPDCGIPSHRAEGRRQRGHPMTAPELTPAEARIVAAFDAAPPAPESYACTCGHEGLTAQWHADTCGRVAAYPSDQPMNPDEWMELPAVEPVDDALATDLHRRMLDVADNLDYYADHTTGGTAAHGYTDAAAKIREALR